ncbi:MAG: hypothetical protein AC479_02865 [miscellaneous Crenarchaeota group-6 archaeon AD8-1]|nr:MAG: hypothetical protein AC479_02865 [miscellaneous Crenarchaeota group-6 archaeon AD8-1]
MSIKELKTLNIKTIIITTILSAFSFLVALTWRDAIQKTLNTFLPEGEGLFYDYLIAIIITIIAVTVTYTLLQIEKRNILPSKIKNKKNQANKT